jgi:hypothetical protein
MSARPAELETGLRLRYTIVSFFLSSYECIERVKYKICCEQLGYSRLIPAARRPVLSVALLTVDWPALGGLERNFALLSAVAADSLMHLAWASVEASSITQLFHSYSVGIL